MALFSRRSRQLKESNPEVELAQRVTNQILSQRPGWMVENAGGFGVSVTANGATRWFGLTQLYSEIEGNPSTAAPAVARFAGRVRVEMEALPQLGRSELILCVRSGRYLDGVRRDELVWRHVCGELYCFVAAQQPGLIMQGLSRRALAQAGMDDEQALAVAQENTEARFGPTIQRLQGSQAVPRDGWRLRGDVLFQGSLLLVPAALEAFWKLAQGEVWFGNPERGTLLAVARSADGARLFPDRVRREYRRAMEPASAQVFSYGDGQLEVVKNSSRKRGAGSSAAAFFV